MSSLVSLHQGFKGAHQSFCCTLCLASSACRTMLVRCAATVSTVPDSLIGFQRTILYPEKPFMIRKRQIDAMVTTTEWQNGRPMRSADRMRDIHLLCREAKFLREMVFPVRSVVAGRGNLHSPDVTFRLLSHFPCDPIALSTKRLGGTTSGVLPRVWNWPSLI